MIKKTKFSIPVTLTTDDLKKAERECNLLEERRRVSDEAAEAWLHRRSKMTQAERDREDEQLAGFFTPE